MAGVEDRGKAAEQASQSNPHNVEHEILHMTVKTAKVVGVFFSGRNATLACASMKLTAAAETGKNKARTGDSQSGLTPTHIASA